MIRRINECSASLRARVASIESFSRFGLLLISLVGLISTRLFCQEATGNFQGIVVDITNDQPLKDVIVKIEQPALATITNNSGAFRLSNIAAGGYQVKFVKDGYLTLILSNQIIQAGQTTFIRAELASGAGMAGDVFHIGAIEISAEKELLPDQAETVTLIKSSDIEHIQATSLGDVLDLVPGAELKNQPALKAPVTAMIRDPRSNNAMTSFGAKIIIDDVPYANNANLQGPLLSGVYTGTGNGVDLREIPADNIASVEVVRGIAPASQGDYIGGLVAVKTKFGSQPNHRLKVKNNPDTKELNLGGSFSLGKTGLNYNLNWGYSEQDIRKDYDDTQRLAAQLNLKNSFLNNELTIGNQLKYSKLIETVHQNPDDPDALVSINKGYRLIFGNQLECQLDPISRLKSNLYLNYRRVNSYKQYRIIADNRVVSTRMEPGTMIGEKKYNSYLHRCTTVGDEVSLGHELEWSHDVFIGKYFHAIDIGSDLQYDDNFGQGRSFDLLYPANSGDRPRSFSAVPGILQHGIYVNDQITGKLWKDFTLNLGLRFERYTTDRYDKLQFFDSSNGAFFNPRMNLTYYWGKNSQMRLGYGKFSKAPSLNYIYPDPLYLDVPDIVPIYRDTDTLLVRDSLITTYIYATSNPKLKGFQEEKIELSFDRRIGDFGVSLTAFYSRRTGEPISQVNPFLYYQYFRPNFPTRDGESIADTLMDSFTTQINAGWSKFDGVELTLTSRRIKKLNLDFNINAAYHHVKSGANGLGWGLQQADFTIPMYQRTAHWTQKLLLTYQVNYLSQSLGIWASITAQQVPHYQTKRLGFADSLAVAYYQGRDSQIVPIPESERFDEKYKPYRLTKDPLDYKAYIYPNKWIVNFRVSKSLFPGAELSFYVNNFLDDRAFYEDQKYPGRFHPRNPEIFYGIEFSTQLDKIFEKEHR